MPTLGSSSQARRRDRWAIFVGLGAVSGAAWLYLVVWVRPMPPGVTGQSMGHAMQSITEAAPWSLPQFGARLVMWAVWWRECQS